jgi:hypothetical protein
MILFSGFESIVKDRVLKSIKNRRAGIEDPLLGGIIDASLVEIKARGFSRVLEIFKAVDAGLVEEMNQVDPEIAYKRLRRFLEAMTEA